MVRRSLSLSAQVGSKQLTVRDALNMALDEELARDERVSSPSFVPSDIFEANREIT
jgi:hypothetical protein